MPSPTHLILVLTLLAGLQLIAAETCWDSAHQGCYLSGYTTAGSKGYSEADAKTACAANSACGGITYEPEQDLWTLRAGSTYQYGGTAETSIIKVQCASACWDSVHEGCYLSGYTTAGSKGYSEADAKTACAANSACGGITYEPEQDLWTLRVGGTYHCAGTAESSITKVSCGSNPPQTKTWDASRGWDFQDHTKTHNPLANYTTIEQIREELQSNNDVFPAHGMPAPNHIGYPHGSYDDRVLSILSEYRRSARTINREEYNTWGNIDWKQLHGHYWENTTGVDQVKKYINTCVTKKCLLMLYTHEIKDGAVEKTPYSYLKAVVAYAVSLKNQGKLKIMTHAEAYDLWSTATSQPPATIVFTFDDGWRTDCTKVYPLFKSYGIKGTSYIISQLHGEAPIESYMTWPMIEKMYKNQASCN